ncbi:hypothetical protein D3C81_1956960 [compost metagenome]
MSAIQRQHILELVLDVLGIDADGLGIGVDGSQHFAQVIDRHQIGGTIIQAGSKGHWLG